MRSTIICGAIAALALTACGRPETKAPDAAARGEDFSGRLIAVGDGFRLDADEELGVVLVYPREDLTVTGPYAAPQQTETGWLLQSNDIALTLMRGACTHDGASYPMRASVTITNSRALEGCAVMRWDRHLLALMPQIDACLAQSPDTRWVTYAGENENGVVTVRLQGDGKSIDCGVTTGVVALADRREDLRIGGEGFAVFVRGPGENPGGECYEAPEVRAANGELLGWMADPEGC